MADVPMFHEKNSYMHACMQRAKFVCISVQVHTINKVVYCNPTSGHTNGWFRLNTNRNSVCVNVVASLPNEDFQKLTYKMKTFTDILAGIGLFSFKDTAYRYVSIGSTVDL